MPGSLPSLRSRSSRDSRRSLPYNLRLRVPPALVSNQIAEGEAETSSSTSSSGIIFEDFPKPYIELLTFSLIEVRLESAPYETHL